MRNEMDKLKRYFWFSKDEWKALLITVIVFAFILSFNFWGAETFDAQVGFTNFIIAIVVVALSLFVHHAAHRVYGIYQGYKVEHKLWWYGLLASLIITLVSGGTILAFMAAGVFIRPLRYHRLGRFRRFMQVQDMSRTAVVGPLASLLVAAIATAGTGYFFDRLLIFNLLYAAYSFLPIPPLDGSRIFFASRFWYVFTFIAIISYAILVYASTVSLLANIIVSLIVGFIAAAVFYALIET